MTGRIIVREPSERLLTDNLYLLVMDIWVKAIGEYAHHVLFLKSENVILQLLEYTWDTGNIK